MQLWSQNIQDLGICEELVCQDDFNIPDVDLTFQNFEELFGGDQDPIRVMHGDEDVSFSSLEKDMSVDKSDIFNTSAMEVWISSIIQHIFITCQCIDNWNTKSDNKDNSSGVQIQGKINKIPYDWDKLLFNRIVVFLSWKDSSAAASVTILHSDHENKDMNPLNQYNLRSRDHAHTIRPFQSTISLSDLRFSAESNHSDRNDSALSPYSEGKDYFGN